MILSGVVEIHSKPLILFHQASPWGVDDRFLSSIADKMGVSTVTFLLGKNVNLDTFFLRKVC